MNPLIVVPTHINEAAALNLASVPIYKGISYNL